MGLSFIRWHFALSTILGQGPPLNLLDGKMGACRLEKLGAVVFSRQRR